MTVDPAVDPGAALCCHQPTREMSSGTCSTPWTLSTGSTVALRCKVGRCSTAGLPNADAAAAAVVVAPPATGRMSTGECEVGRFEGAPALAGTPAVPVLRGSGGRGVAAIVATAAARRRRSVPACCQPPAPPLLPAR